MSDRDLLDWLTAKGASVERCADGWYVEWTRPDGYIVGSTRAKLRDAIRYAAELDEAAEAVKSPCWQCGGENGVHTWFCSRETAQEGSGRDG